MSGNTLAVQAELEAELALAWGQLYGRRLDISRQVHIGQDRGHALGDATSIPAELRCVSYLPDPCAEPWCQHSRPFSLCQRTSRQAVWYFLCGA